MESSDEESSEEESEYYDSDEESDDNCISCKQRPKSDDGDYCVVCYEFLGKDLVWKCPAGHVQHISHPLGKDVTWACRSCNNELTKWKPVNDAAVRLRRTQMWAMNTVSADYHDTLGGLTSFEHYLTHYDKCNSYPSKEKVRDAMVRLASIVGQGMEFSSSTFDILVTKDVEHLYTSEQLIGTDKFYAFINKFLHGRCNCRVMDDAIMPFIRRMNGRIVPYQQPQREVHRGQTFKPKTIKKLERMKPPRSIRLPGFLSTTLKKDKAFSGNARLIIRVFQQCPNAYYLAESSTTPSEAEVLFPPYSAFIIRKTKMRDGVLHVWMDALDNADVPGNFDYMLIH